jgi:hypothetical protein
MVITIDLVPFTVFHCVLSKIKDLKCSTLLSIVLTSIASPWFWSDVCRKLHHTKPIGAMLLFFRVEGLEINLNPSY